MVVPRREGGGGTCPVPDPVPGLVQSSVWWGTCLLPSPVGGGYPSPRSHGVGEGPTLDPGPGGPLVLCLNPLPRDRQTENITFPHTTVCGR